ncbi:MAG: NAD(P)H-dependent oxidoreductase [Leptospiraceae bacterium]|nr:NAD(P)H-dependent oxidoreductase [Leptospiraceae bacterium]MCP5494714.1 NAD(P)H-dependent oxidoreductase [Leptospiraceae bacterium]
MNIFIVHAHENPESFCSALKNKAVEIFETQGDHVEISDLYKMNFNPIASQKDFKSLSSAPYYKFQMEQKHAAENGLFADDLKAEMQKLENADLLIFNFPLWWFSIPAILKGWVDRVFAFGYSYGGDIGVYSNAITFKDKKALLCFTTGGSEKSYQKDSMHAIDVETMLQPIQYNIFRFNGMVPLEPFIVFGPARLSEDALKLKLLEYEKYLLKVRNILKK